MKLKITSCFLLTMLMHLTAFPQVQQVTPVSPEAAALAKMVNYPIDLSTGVPDISIPLYTIETGGMKLPVALQYHAGAFNINEHSGRAGLGWSLSCELQITRSANGMDDFQYQGYLQNSKVKSHGNPANNYPLGGPYWMNDYRISTGYEDGAPDKFNYRLLNKSGSFYFRKEDNGTGYTIVPVPYDNIKIAYANGVFTIVDTDGTSYVFGVSGQTPDGSMAPLFREVTGNVFTSWKCKSVINATNTDTILFTYQDKAPEEYFSRPESVEYYSNSQAPDCLAEYYTAEDVGAGITQYDQLAYAFPIYRLSSPKYIENFSGKPSVFHLPYVRLQNGSLVVEDHSYTMQTPASTSVSIVKGIALSKIEFRGGKVEFSGAGQLGAIEVRHSDNSLLRSFGFYHTQSSTNQPNDRPTLYLDSIHMKKSNGEIYERYHLLYKNKLPFGDGIVGKDAWGYPNGFTTNYDQYSTSQFTVPKQGILQRFYTGCQSFYDNVTFLIGNAINTELGHREGAQRGILRRIVYPTGGYVNFDFESHKYKEAGAGGSLAVQMGGGLRIRAITYYDGMSITPVSQKYYRYGELEDGIGTVLHAPSRTYDGATFKYNTSSYTQDVAYVKGPTDPGQPCLTKSCLSLQVREVKTTYLPASAQNYTYANGAPVYYTKVTEYNSDLGKETGKIVHVFYPPEEFTPLVPSKIPGTNIDYLRSDGLMGRQKLMEEYKYHNGQYSLFHSKEFMYTKYSQPAMIKVVYSFNGGDVKIVGGNYTGTIEDLYNPNISFGGGGIQGFNAGQYGIEVGKLLLTGETEKWITDAGTLTQHTSYQYNNSSYQQPSVIEITGSDGKTIRKSLKYCYDFSGQPAYAQMLAKNMISQIIEEQVVIASTGAPVSTTRTNYNLFSGSFLAPSSIQRSYGGGQLITEIQYDLYDNRANLLQSTGKDGIVTSYIWGYRQKYPLSKNAGLSYTTATTGVDVAALQTLTSDVQIRNALNNIRTSNPDGFITSFTYKPLVGVSSSTDPAGITSFFEYDPAGRLITTKDNNQQVTQAYGYEMLNTSFYLALNIHTGITADMESYNKTGANNTRTIYNYTVPGGARNFFGESVPYPYFISDDDGMQYQPSEKDGLAVADVLMELYAWFDPMLPLPAGFHLDLLKNGSVVYTKKFKYVADHSPVQLYIPQGEYQVNLRVDDNFENCILNNHFYSAPGTGQPSSYFTMNGPVTVNFIPGIIYSITSFNY